MRNLWHEFKKYLSPQEKAEHRAKGLCFFCHDSFSQDHKCAQRQKLQLHFIEATGLEIVEKTQADKQTLNFFAYYDKP